MKRDIVLSGEFILLFRWNISSPSSVFFSKHVGTSQNIVHFRVSSLGSLIHSYVCSRKTTNEIKAIIRFSIMLMVYLVRSVAYCYYLFIYVNCKWILSGGSDTTIKQHANTHITQNNTQDSNKTRYTNNKGHIIQNEYDAEM
jgi:hypothetical protein